MLCYRSTPNHSYFFQGQHYELDLKAWVFLLIHIEFATAGITGIQKERIIP